MSFITRFALDISRLTIVFIATVIVLGLPYLKPGGRYEGVVALNARLPQIAADAGVQFVEIWDPLVNSGLSDNQLLRDPIHPSAAAHTIMAETIHPFVVSAGGTCGDLVCDAGDIRQQHIPLLQHVYRLILVAGSDGAALYHVELGIIVTAEVTRLCHLHLDRNSRHTDSFQQARHQLLVLLIQY